MTTTITPSNDSWRMAKATAPMMRRMAGRRLFPLWAVVHHRGRKTGRDLSLPVALLHTEDVFVITLPWGAGTNWVRNVLAAGECTITWKGRDHAATEPRILDRDEARPYYDGFSWWMVEKAFKADSFLALRR